jgi:hypothetical protein
MTTRADRIAQVVRRRHAVAAERRRLLAFALHAEDDEFDDQVTAERTPSRVARGTTAPPIAPFAGPADSTYVADGGPPAETTLAMRVEILRAQTAAFRTQAIAHNAKLAMAEAARHELYALREQLADSSARLSHAVDEIDAVTRLDEQLTSLTP